ncbi:hypothetical protein Tco_1252203 [Tanacetum coccineum]
MLLLMIMGPSSWSSCCVFSKDNDDDPLGGSFLLPPSLVPLPAHLNAPLGTTVPAASYHLLVFHHEVHQSHFVDTPLILLQPQQGFQYHLDDIKTYSTRRKSLATRMMPSFEVDLNAPDTSFIRVLSDDDSDASDDDTDPLFWHIFAAWEVIPTGLGDDLSKLYGMVVKHYEVNPLAGNGLILWGDLHVLFESTTGGSSVEV